jgi:hypothetical protein
MGYSYNDIPDSIRTKRYFPLGRHLWRIYRELGWPYFEKNMGDAINGITYDLIKTRLNEAILTAKATIEGEIKNPETVIADTLFPPGGSIRADLSQGVMKLYYGDSTDCTYAAIRDDTQEICFGLNAHLSDGIPVDWWFIGPDDELLERRHLKLGYKLKDIPKKTKNLTDIGYRMIDILKDVRNERTPQWVDSLYQTCAVWGTGAWNLAFEFSSYEGIAGLYDGIAAKMYGLPDYWFSYIPWPPLVQTAIYSGRQKFIHYSVGLMAESRLYFQHLEDDWRDVTKRDFPEIWDSGIIQQWKTMGVPFPKQTLECQVPNFKREETYKTEKFEFIYPKGEWITLDRLRISLDDVFKGYYFDITHETDPQIEDIPSKIISTGIGRYTQFIHPVTK